MEETETVHCVHAARGAEKIVVGARARGMFVVSFDCGDIFPPSPSKSCRPPSFGEPWNLQNSPLTVTLFKYAYLILTRLNCGSDLIREKQGQMELEVLT